MMVVSQAVFSRDVKPLPSKADLTGDIVEEV